MLRKYDFDQDGRDRIWLDEIWDGMEVFNLKKLNPNPIGCMVVSPASPASCKQKQFLSQLVYRLGQKGIRAEMPEPETLRKGECFDAIRQSLEKLRRIECGQ